MPPADRPDVLRKVTARLVPFLGLLYLLNLLDRQNVGFAALTMQRDLGLSKEIFDLGAGIFYLGYLVFEVPANFLLRRVGARRWIARIMITWGLVSCATAFVSGPVGFYAVRILLGVAEAGFFPGIILYLTYWFPARDRVRVMALFMTASPLYGIVGNPLSGAIMQLLDNVGGLRDWQWLFLLEGVPSVLVGISVLFVLPDGPRSAMWLTDGERRWLAERLDAEELHRQVRHGSDWREVAFRWRVWLLIAVYFTLAVGANASGVYFPRLIKDRFPELDKLGVGLLAAIPSVCAIVGMVVIGANSDRTGERRGHVAFSAALAAVGWGLSALTEDRYLFLAGLCLAQTGMMGMMPCFWALPTAILSGAAAAAGIALINSVGNLGGLVAPNVVGLLGPGAVAGVLASGAVLAMCIPPEAELAAPPPSGGSGDDRVKSGEGNVVARPPVLNLTPPPPLRSGEGETKE